MLASVVPQVTARAQRSQIRWVVVGGILIQMGAGQDRFYPAPRRPIRLSEKAQRAASIVVAFTGFRVQLFNGNRQEAQKVKSGFSSQFPELLCYLTYQSPEYKVQVGDCRNEWEAEKLRKELHASYPAAIVVKAEIQMPKGK